MLITLDVPYVDTAAGRLSFTLGLPPQPALHDLRLDAVAGPGTGLRLLLLGASHQALLHTPAGVLSETVACLPGDQPDLPGVARGRIAGADYRFRSAVHRHPPQRFAEEVARLRRQLADRPDAVVGEFPGDRDAVTALLAEPTATPAADGVTGLAGWRTWHAYPCSGEIVYTHSTVEVAA